MQNKSYSDLLTLVQALSGVDAFTTLEQSKVLSMANRRLYEAYDFSPTWPRYIVGAQVRPAVNNVIAREYDNVAGIRASSSASRSATTVTIVCTAAVTFASGMSVTISGLSGTVTPNGTFTVTGIQTTNVENDTFTYSLSSGSGSETYSGTAAVSPVAIADIADFNRIWNANPFSTNGFCEYEFFVDSDGATIINNATSNLGFWVGYKKEWPGPYTTVSTDLPLEFFYYAAHATYADFLRMDGQVDKAIAEEQIAMNYLMLELSKAQNQRNNNALFRRISTYVSTQSRQ
jgi:hypothetical protein